MQNELALKRSIQERENQKRILKEVFETEDIQNILNKLDDIWSLKELSDKLLQVKTQRDEVPILNSVYHLVEGERLIRLSLGENQKIGLLRDNPNIKKITLIYQD